MSGKAGRTRKSERLAASRSAPASKTTEATKTKPAQTKATPVDEGVRVEKQEGAVPYVELGATGLEMTGGRVAGEFLLDLSGERAWKKFHEMSENDPVVGAMLYAVEMLLRGVALEVEPWSDEAADAEVAEFFDGLLQDMSHSWAQFMAEWMAAPVYGFAPFEIVYKLRQGQQASPGESSRFDDGKVGIRKLAIRHPTTLSRWEFDEAGGVQAMVQRASSFGGRTVTIPIEKMLLFTVMARKGSPEGTSLLRRAYVPWYRKTKIEELESIGIERDLAGLPHFEVPASWLNPDASASEKALLTGVKQAGRRIRQDEQACVITPMMYDAEGRKAFEFRLVSTAGRRQFDTTSIIQRLDTRIAMTMMADVILLGHEKVGSFALASSKTNLFASGLGALLRGIEDTLNRHLVPRVLKLNGMDLRRPPSYRFGDIESRDLGELGEYLQKLGAAGMALFPSEDQELERELMRVADLPPPGAPPPEPEPVEPPPGLPPVIVAPAAPGAPPPVPEGEES